jgi:outer membrane protein, heavy metal efflux system
MSSNRTTSLKRLSALVTGALVLVGCVRFESQTLVPEKTAKQFNERSLEDPLLRDYLGRNLTNRSLTWPLPAWDLDDLVLAGLYFHPDLDLARAHWAVARAGGKTARERPNPTLTVAPAYNTSQGIPTPWLVTAALDIPVETAGKRGYRVALADQLSEAARWNVASVAWAVRSRIRDSLLNLSTALQSETLLREQQSIQEENLRILEGQFQLGAISSFERTQARIAADGTRLALRDSERQREEFRVQLADAIGVPVKALSGIPLSFSTVEALPTELPDDELRAKTLFHRADLMSLLAEFEASQSALQLEIARQYPDIHLGPGYDYDQGNNKWSIGPSLTLPLLSRNQGAIAEAKARREEVAAAFLSVQAHALADLERSASGYRASLQKVADVESLRINLLKQESSAQSMLAAGEISKSDLAALRLQLSSAALARLDSLTKSRQAYGLLEDAMQTSLHLSPKAWETSDRETGLHAQTVRP